MFRRASLGVALISLSSIALLPALAVAQEPDGASASGPDCATADQECVAAARLPLQGPRVIPSRPGELAEGRGDQSTAVLVTLALVSFGGLVVSVLNRLADDD